MESVDATMLGFMYPATPSGFSTNPAESQFQQAMHYLQNSPKVSQFEPLSVSHKFYSGNGFIFTSADLGNGIFLTAYSPAFATSQRKISLEINAPGRSVNVLTEIIKKGNRLANSGLLDEQFRELVTDWREPTDRRYKDQQRYKRVIFQAPLLSTLPVGTVLKKNGKCIQLAKYLGYSIPPTELPEYIAQLSKLIIYIIAQ